MEYGTEEYRHWQVLKAADLLLRAFAGIRSSDIEEFTNLSSVSVKQILDLTEDEELWGYIDGRLTQTWNC